MALGCLLAGGVDVRASTALLDPHPRSRRLAAALAVVGFGLGLALVAVTRRGARDRAAGAVGDGRLDAQHEPQLGGVLAVAILGAVVNGRLVGELKRKLDELGVPPASSTLIIDAVTHGGVPANAAQAAQSNPIVAANIGLVARVLAAAEAAFGHGLHVALVVAAAILLAGATTAALTVER